MISRPAAIPAPRLAPPQANPDAQPDTVCWRTQWANEVEAYVRDLRATLDEMRRANMTKREQDRIDRLVTQLGHMEALAALQHAARMQMALKVIHTWMSMPAMNTPEQIRSVCAKALSKDAGHG